MRYHRDRQIYELITVLFHYHAVAEYSRVALNVGRSLRGKAMQPGITKFVVRDCVTIYDPDVRNIFANFVLVRQKGDAPP